MEEHSSLTLGQKLLVVAADVLVLAEICWAMYSASLTPDEITRTFLRAFLPLALPTVIGAVIGIRLLRERRQPQAQARS